MQSGHVNTHALDMCSRLHSGQEATWLHMNGPWLWSQKKTRSRKTLPSFGQGRNQDSWVTGLHAQRRFESASLIYQHSELTTTAQLRQWPGPSLSFLLKQNHCLLCLIITALLFICFTQWKIFCPIGSKGPVQNLGPGWYLAHLASYCLACSFLPGSTCIHLLASQGATSKGGLEKSLYGTLLCSVRVRELETQRFEPPVGEGLVLESRSPTAG